jgi:hypothetical protein
MGRGRMRRVWFRFVSQVLSGFGFLGRSLTVLLWALSALGRVDERRPAGDVAGVS